LICAEIYTTLYQEKNMTKTIGILTGGGDVPGLNPAIKSVVLGALGTGLPGAGHPPRLGGLLHYNLDEPSPTITMFASSNAMMCAPSTAPAAPSCTPRAPTRRK
jgi:hypothetical protein